MVTKQKIIEIAKQYNWTTADAEKAVQGLILNDYSENEILLKLLYFAGKELQKRQREQATQKGQVTKLKKEINAKEKINLEIQRLAKMYDYEESILRDFANFVNEKQVKQKTYDYIKSEIEKIANEKKYHEEVLNYFAQFIIEGPDRKLNRDELKAAIYQHFGVKDKDALMQLSSFKMATSGIKNINFCQIESLENIYRNTIGILPHERYELGYGCINGNNIFKYNLPWRIFCLNPQTATKEQVKSAYKNLAKIYYPDNSETGDKEIFHRLQILYESVIDFI